MDDLQYKVLNLYMDHMVDGVLNLVINGWPSILKWIHKNTAIIYMVLNLVINGWPSIQEKENGKSIKQIALGFKPCYKWMTFNTIAPSVDSLDYSTQF